MSGVVRKAPALTIRVGQIDRKCAITDFDGHVHQQAAGDLRDARDWACRLVRYGSSTACSTTRPGSSGGCS
jgi:hypothetical protein